GGAGLREEPQVDREPRPGGAAVRHVRVTQDLASRPGEHEVPLDVEVGDREPVGYLLRRDRVGTENQTRVPVDHRCDRLHVVDAGRAQRDVHAASVVRGGGRDLFRARRTRTRIAAGSSTSRTERRRSRTYPAPGYDASPVLKPALVWLNHGA